MTTRTWARLILVLLAVNSVLLLAGCDDSHLTTNYPGNGAAGTESVMPALQPDDWQPFRLCQQVGDAVWCSTGN